MQRIQAPTRQPKYRVLNGSRAEFEISDFGLSDPFASFLPGIAGPLGVPLWCFYVNRGQGVCAFGVENKDGAILEFEPANKAYRNASLTGFRTFLRLDGGRAFYEPFQENQANLGMQRSTRMVIAPHELRLIDENLSLGLRVSVRYFTLPNRPLAALCRELSIENIGAKALTLELMDGLPCIAPQGLGDMARKTMGRTMEAWSHAEGLDQRVPYFRQRYSSEDAVEVKPVLEGHFFAATIQAQPGLLNVVVDPGRVFGAAGDLGFPSLFASGEMSAEGQQVENRSPCAFARAMLTLEPERPLRVSSVIGKAPRLKAALDCASELCQPGSFDAWAQENEKMILGAASRGWISSESEALDGYALQTFLDNVLRGGLAVTLRDGERKSALHLYSRKHGDLERDYNAFNLMPSPFSQGNGAFRDICQNRRNDIWNNPDLGDSGVRYFADLIQADGNNPLIVRGLEYIWEGGDEGLKRLASLLVSGDAEALAERLKTPYSPRTIHEFCAARGLEKPGLLAELCAAALTRSRAIEKADADHGYWIDHGFYLTDLLESFERLYPDRMQALLADESFSFYDSPLLVASRAEKLKKTPQGWRQYGSVKHDKEKATLIASRALDPQLSRTEHGLGEVFRSSLWAKLFCLAANKLGSLDAQGLGLEMDSDKPDWNDAVNGLPGLFGSSSNESLELKRLLLKLKSWLRPEAALALPRELAELMAGLQAAPESAFEFWERCGELKDQYRAATRLGFDGPLQTWDSGRILAFLEGAISRLNRGLMLAQRPDGLLHAYFVNTPQIDESGAAPKIIGFKQQALPLFLEGQVHALRLASASEAAALAEAVEGSELYDQGLGMFKVNASLEGTPMEIGRLRAFTPGWLENESVFMHMEFKYLLELLKRGLFSDYYRHLSKACPAFLSGASYGRSLFENSSFIASSANPDSKLRGRGFVARLSGTTCEFYEMTLALALGPNPFSHENGILRFSPRPAISGAWFLAKDRMAEMPDESGGRKVLLEAGTFSLKAFGQTLLVIHGRHGEDSFAPGITLDRIETLEDGRHASFEGGLHGAEAERLREGRYERVDIWLKRG